ncbi:MAG TPA: wax ester/triacylglycerol synthase domain-containing protein [Terriglobales bacterium]|nr:wax ester/triacylglycerol synthase domain-containing protein [Terriglobales bacterium]
MGSKNCNRFSWGDAAFLYLEREGTPLNVASVFVFEGKLALQDCIDLVEKKLPLLPRYQQRVSAPPYNLGLPTWEYSPHFDIHDHIREVKLKSGTEAELKRVAGAVLSPVMDRRRPLWDLTLLQGLKGGNTGLVARIHHCLADGIAGIGLMNVLLDSTPVPSAARDRSRRVSKQPQRDSGAVLLESLAESYSEFLNKLLTTQAEVLKLAQDVISRNGTQPFGDLAAILPEMTAPAERLPFNKVCRGPQKFAWTRFPMAGMKAIRERCGGKFNDVVLTIVTSAFRKYAEAQKVKTANRLLRLVVPVNARGDGDTRELGNRISFIPVPVPLDIRDPRKLLANVSGRTQLIKSTRIAEFVGLMATVLGAIPASIQALIGPIASQLPLSVCNSICTNVPGPQEPVFLLGHKMLSWYPYVPIGGEMGINCAIITYNGYAHIGFTGDVYAAPDLERIEHFANESFAELCAAAGVTMERTPRRKHATRQRAKTATKDLSRPKVLISESEESQPIALAAIA